MLDALASLCSDERNRAKAGLQCALDERSYLVRCLDSIDRLLNLTIEILNTEAQTIESKGGQVPYTIGIDGARVNFNGEFAFVARIKIKRVCEMTHQVAELLAIQVGWCSATEMQLLDFAAAIKQLCLHLDFPVKHLEIAVHPSLVMRHDLVAAAVIAERMAERDVHVERQRYAAAITCQCMPFIVLRGDAIAELEGRRVGRIAWPPASLTDDQIGVEADAGMLALLAVVGNHG